MTISVTITNEESAQDATKELLLEFVRPDKTPFQQQTLRGGQSVTVYVHTHAHLLVSERFTDKVPP
jgi:hypothetical protein